jgi:superfamily II DNA or RNA helicase
MMKRKLKMTLLRDYQRRAVEKIFKEWEEVRSTLVVQPTGTGKTTVFTDVVKGCQPERALILPIGKSDLSGQGKDRGTGWFGMSDRNG